MLLRLVSGLLVICLGTPALAACPPGIPTLLQNGDFQSGNFADWSVNASYTTVLSQPYDGYSPLNGASYAILGPVGGNGTLSQTFADTAGQVLTISFYLASDGGQQNDFSATFDNHTLLSLTNIPAQGWTEYSFTETATGTERLGFAFRDDPGYLALDGISVTRSAIPEPATYALFPLALAALAKFRLTRFGKSCLGDTLRV